MPELPEVEVITSYINKKVSNKKIKKIDIMLARLLKNISVEEFLNSVKEQTILSVERKGKYIVFYLSNKKYLIMHLRMTGRLIYLEPGKKNEDKFAKIFFYLADKSTLVFSDVRTFGSINLVNSLEKTNIYGFDNLGIEPFSEEFTIEALSKFIVNSRSNIKSLLLNQTKIAGIGNIYADETLFLSKILPVRIANTLTKKEIKKLHESILVVLKTSIKNGGTSFSDFLDGLGKKGKNQDYLNVYGRKNDYCKICSSHISYTKVAGRGTYYCKICQK